MTSAQVQRILSFCEVIWGKSDYDIDIETDDYISYIGVVRKDFGLEFGPPLTLTNVCFSTKQVWKELDRMLSAWASQIQSGKPMTKEQKLYIFGGPNGMYVSILGKFIDELEKRKQPV